MGHRLAPQAQADIDDIAYCVFGESGSLETAAHQASAGKDLEAIPRQDRRRIVEKIASLSINRGHRAAKDSRGTTNTAFD